MDPELTSQEDDIPGTIPKTVLPGIPEWVRSKALCGCGDAGTDRTTDGDRLEGGRRHCGPGQARRPDVSGAEHPQRLPVSAARAAEGVSVDETSKEQYYGQWWHNAGIVSGAAGVDNALSGTRPALTPDRLRRPCDPLFHLASLRLGLAFRHSGHLCHLLLSFDPAHPPACPRRHPARAQQDPPHHRQ